MSDPAKETRARDLSRNCAAWSAKTSRSTIPEAPLARDLRLLVRERIAAGDSDAQVIDFLVARYGEFVLLKPPQAHTLLLWLLPPLALAGGGLRCGCIAAAPEIRGSGGSVLGQADLRRRNAAAKADRGGSRPLRGRLSPALGSFALR